VLTGPDATEYGFKRDAPGHRLVHLASHGVADDREPLYSKLVLAVDENGVDDGFLHAYEVSRMNLDCELVVLSACETALGALSGGEGLLGLSRSFLHAGSSSIVASLWSVDESTEEVMAEFYRHLADGKGNALRKAKLKVRQMERDGMSLAHPFFWAPFVLIGDWQ
jgi:CHAT domain-containing protein